MMNTFQATTTLTPTVVTWPVLVAVQDHKVSFGYSPFEFDSLARVVCCHLLEIVDEGLLAVTNSRVVLDVGVANELFDGLSWLALVEHQVVERLCASLHFLCPLSHGFWLILFVVQLAARERSKCQGKP